MNEKANDKKIHVLNSPLSFTGTEYSTGQVEYLSSLRLRRAFGSKNI